MKRKTFLVRSAEGVLVLLALFVFWIGFEFFSPFLKRTFFPDPPAPTSPSGRGKYPPKMTQNYTFDPPSIYDEWSQSKANFRYRQVLKDENPELGFSVDYVIGPTNRRGDFKGTSSKGSVILLGCSFVYGVGLSLDQTLSFSLGRRLGQTVYNFGFAGFGPPALLWKVQNTDWKSEVSEQKGTIVYTFFDDHVRRTVGSISFRGIWGNYWPYFVEKDGALTFAGKYRDLFPLHTWLFSLLAESALVRVWGLDWPLRFSEEHFRLTALYLKSIRDEMRLIYPERKFVVHFFPGASVRFGPQVRAELERMGVEVWDHSNYPLGDEVDGYVLYADYHPTPRTIEKVAEWMAGEMRK